MIRHELYLIDNLVFTETKKHLYDLQKKIILMLLDGKKYSEIAENLGYDEGYIGDKSRQLFKILSQQTGEDVNKYNFCWVVERLIESRNIVIGWNSKKPRIQPLGFLIRKNLDFTDRSQWRSR